MKKSDAVAMLGLFEAAYSFRYTDAQEKLWTEYMADVAVEVGFVAARSWIAENPRAPTIADMRKRVSEHVVGAPDADQAWAEVQAAARKHGLPRRYFRAHLDEGRGGFEVVGGEPTWRHPAIAEAVAAVGWERLCLTELEQLGTLFAQFRDTYNQGKGRAVREANTGAFQLPAGEPQKLIAEAAGKLHVEQPSGERGRR